VNVAIVIIFLTAVAALLLGLRARHGREMTLEEWSVGGRSFGTVLVFILLAGAVFGIFSATLQSVSSLQDNQNRNDQVESLGAWLKQSLLAMPATGTVASYRRDNIPFHVAGVIWGANEDLQALDLHLQQNGLYTLRLAAYQPPATTSLSLAGVTGTALPLSQFMTQVVNNDPTLAWRPLVRDVKAADWRFRAFNVTDWQTVTSGPKPALVEFTFQPAGALAPIVDDFWIPPTQPAGNPAAAPAVTVNP